MKKKAEFLGCRYHDVAFGNALSRNGCPSKRSKLLVKHKISGAPVVDENQRLLGMFTEKSCLEVMIDAAYDGLPANEVGAFMDEPADTVSADTGMLSMAQIFLNKKTRRLPVISDGKLVGQVSRRGLDRRDDQANEKIARASAAFALPIGTTRNGRLASLVVRFISSRHQPLTNDVIPVSYGYAFA